MARRTMRLPVPVRESPPPQKSLHGADPFGGHSRKQTGRVMSLLPPSIRWVVLDQESRGCLQHLPPCIAARHPVILVLELDQLHVLVCRAHGVIHDLALLIGTHGVVLPMDQQYRYLDRIRMPGGRDGIEFWIRLAA